MIDMLLVAQVSSSLTILMGIIALIFTIKAISGLAEDSFKTLVKRMAVFLILSIIGIAFMTSYHIMESYGGLDITIDIWYIFMFMAIAYSIYDSYKTIKFEKPIYSIALRTKKKKR
ncbi:MAG: hypothetical protein AABX17_01160 [Nanoarchaeota archaeon]